jgi:hypothetical protein
MKNGRTISSLANADRSAESYKETLFAFDVDFFRAGCYNYYGKL